MLQLNNYNLNASRSDSVATCNYTRSTVSPGIMHFGVGNFHRTHQAVYADDLLRCGEMNWGIIGVSMRSSKIRDLLAPQDFLYTQVTLSKHTEIRVIGSILDILVAPDDPAAVVVQLADNCIKLITTTITEKAYCLVSGQLDEAHPDFIADLISLARPVTIYGYLAAGLVERHKNDGSPLTILCCDNIQNGGEHLRKGVQLLLQGVDKNAMAWVERNVTFASSMVDRVSPATDEPLKALVRDKLGLDDAWPVSAEPFSQWVIENNFAGERPPFEKVGAVYTQDISLYEQMKLRLLNAGHSIISVLGYLNGKKTVHEALGEPGILEFVQQALCETVLPIATIPEGYSGEGYIKEIIARFENKALPYKVQQVNTDSSQKIQQRWFPSTDDALAQNMDISLWSFTLAAWVLYIQNALDADELNDPLREEFLATHQTPDSITEPFLRIAGSGQFSFSKNPAFMASILKDYNALKHAEITEALAQFLSKQNEVNHA